MLKLKLIIFICAFHLLGFPQTIPPKDVSDFDWTIWEVETSDSIKLERSSKIIGSKYFDNYKFYPEGRVLKNYHTIDFNGDGLTDLIYEGIIVGVDGSIVCFFLNNGDSLKNVIYLLGNITEIQREDESKPISFQVVQSPCCAQFLFTLTNYSFSDTISKIDSINRRKTYFEKYNDIANNLLKIDEYVYPYKIEFPNTLILGDTLILIETKFFTPKPVSPTNIDFTVDRTYFHFENNKAMSELQVGQEYVVLHELVKENSEVYYFVMLKNDSNQNNYCRKINSFQYGWIKKNLL